MSKSRSYARALGARIENLEGRQLFSVVVGLTANNVLVSFDNARPNVVLDRQKVTGLDRGDRLVGIDYRPATGTLYGVGRGESVYTINAVTGVATKIGSGLDTPLSDTASYGVDFNPVVDRLRVVNTEEQNLRINQLTGAIVDSDLVTAGTQLDTSLVYNGADVSAGINPQIAAAAYTNSFAGASTTTLYALDAATGNLVTVGGVNGTPSPNGGLLNTVGSLGVSFTSVAGFDIATQGGVETAYAVLKVAGQPGTRLYTVNLGTGASTFVSRVGGGAALNDIAVMPAGQVMTALAGNRLLSFDIQRPDIIQSSVRVTGMVKGDRLLAIDYRPATGELFSIGRKNVLYNINPDTGVATAVGDGLDVKLGDDEIGFDFNPVVDRIRVVTEDGRNARINQLTGELVDSDLVTAGLQLDTDLTFNGTSNVDVSSVAYTQNFAGTTATTLYGLDFEQDILVTQGSVNGAPTSPNSGQLFAVGSLGVNVTDDDSAFDIITVSGVDRAVAALRVGGKQAAHLYDIDLTTGAATLIGKIGKGGPSVIGLSARP
jgi:hypothetical protein